jgi:hypothetical protein
LEKACSKLKAAKRTINFKVGDVLSSDLDKQLPKTELIYASIAAIFSSRFTTKEKIKKRVTYFRDLIDKASNAIVGTVGIELPKRKLLSEIRWKPSSIPGLKLKIYDSL